jgi:membrane protease YdiL (CAAX protease family)
MTRDGRWAIAVGEETFEEIRRTIPQHRGIRHESERQATQHGGPEQVGLKSAPIIRMLGVTSVVALVIAIVDATLRLLLNYEAIVEDSSWVLGHLAHVPQFVIPFALICYITGGRLREYGFNLKQKPPVFTHRRMLGLGVLFGLLMSLKYVPQAAQGTLVDIPQPVTAVSVLGNMIFQWVVVGLSEETMFRGLIQTYLMTNLYGSIRVIGHDLHLGTVLGAMLWGAFHFINILVMPLGPVVFLVILTTVAGLFMGYAYQETGSLLTTVIVHNTLFGIPLAVGYALYWLL